MSYTLEQEHLPVLPAVRGMPAPLLKLLLGVTAFSRLLNPETLFGSFQLLAAESPQPNDACSN
jgi:hypothetical protein